MLKRLCLTIALLLALPSGATAADGIIDSGSGNTGWHKVWKLRLAESTPLEFEAKVLLGNFRFFGMYVFDENDEKVSHLMGIGATENFDQQQAKYGFHIEASPVGVSAEQFQTAHQGNELTYRMRRAATEPAGIIKLVAFWAGPDATWTYELRGDAGVEVLAAETGTATLYTSKDFPGTLNAVVYAQGLGARLQHETRRTVDIANNLIGWFSNSLASSDALTAVTPAGTETCPCVWNDPTDATETGTGPHTFNLDGAGGGVHILGEILLGVVDVRLP